ncbi:response regulator transcription factor [Paenibacillus sp. JX-17]|uniref:Response regulator transcription factor n=1 Tax=Paenibacillus lacisoli TaxID=3064525 RepID=A0ABT9CG16_9BACL|nr:response regulator transcription factor [Paenibacillus sp. JX-17]MDO7908224.1 response regulator transcription factor [Paenibacillus sp. JX-17]
MSIRLLLADDHAMVRRGMQVFLSTQQDIVLVGEASDGREALEQVAELQPDIILMDLNMPVLDGIQAAQAITASYPEVKVIVMTSFCDPSHVLPAVQAGVKGYLLKDIEPEELAEAIRSVYQGRVELHPDAAGQLMQHVAAGSSSLMETKGISGTTVAADSIDNPDRLTPREREVLALIACGKSNKAIAEELVITEKTVKTHVSHLLDKLGLTDRTQAAIYAVKKGY